MLVYYFVPFIVSNRYLLFWVSNCHNSVTVQNRTHVYMNFFDHKDLGNHLLQLCLKSWNTLYSNKVCHSHHLIHNCMCHNIFRIALSFAVLRYYLMYSFRSSVCRWITLPSSCAPLLSHISAANMPENTQTHHANGFSRCCSHYSCVDAQILAEILDVFTFPFPTFFITSVKFREFFPPPTRSMASSFTRFPDHTQRYNTVSGNPLDEWSARRRGVYLTTSNVYNRKTSKPWRYSNPQSQQVFGRRP